MIENYDLKIDEVNMENVVFHGINKDDFLFIDWIILDGCNYRCSYCFGQSSLDKSQFVPVEKLKHAVDQIFKINRKTYIFNILGGEPTFYPYLMDLVSYIDSFKKNIILSFITNGSRSIEYFNDLISSFKCESIFNISLHMEYVDIKHIEELIKLFNKHKKRVFFSLMTHPEYKEKTYYVFEEMLNLRKKYVFDLYLFELKAPPDFQTIDKRYDYEFIKWIDFNRGHYDFLSNKYMQYDTNLDIRYPLSNNSFYRIEYNNTHKDISITHSLALRNMKRNFKNFYCCSGINLLSIDSMGYYRGGVCPVIPYIGNIYNEDIDIYKLSRYYKCTMEQCGCNTNDCNYKYRYKIDADKYVNDYIIANSNLIISQLNNKLEFNNLQISDLNKKMFEFQNEFYAIKKNVDRIINLIAWWIPVKKWRESFRDKFKSYHE